MTAPLQWVHANVCFGTGPDDAWALFAARPHPYAGLGHAAKQRALARLVAAIEAAGADIQILRVARAFDAARYAAAEGARPVVHPDAHARLLDEHAALLASGARAAPFVALAVRLAEPERDVATQLSCAAERGPRAWLDGLRRGLGGRDRRLLAAAELERQLRRGQTDRLAEQAARTRAHDVRRAPHDEASAERLAMRRARLARRIGEARAAGDLKGVARLRARDAALAQRIAAHRASVSEAGAHRDRAEYGTRGERAAHHAWLDRQATLRRGVRPGPRADPAAYRDYPRLAALAGVAPREYDALAPGPQRRVRLAVDRALRARADAARALAAPDRRARRGALENARPGARALEPWRDADVERRRPSARERQFGGIDDDGRPRDRRRPRFDRDLDA